ncbi:MAG: DNA polymerase IV [Clostridia bacterium]|nr:DNA polymerase IV [Clostridia bacterium]
MRRIFHVDMNSFFASCEVARNNDLKDKHIAVAGDPSARHGIILAASYSAKAYGIKTTMPIWKALKLCPDLIVLPVDFELYREYSYKFMEILREYAPVIEQASIDEAFLDLTGTEKLYPDLYDLAKLIQDRILNELGLSCSIGISENRLLAKMGSDFKKPLGITQLYIEDVKEKMWPLDVGDLLFVGKSTTESLKSIGIYTIGDLANYDEENLANYFGEKGARRLIESANGIDDSEVIPNEEIEVKSNGAEKTFSQDIDDIDILKNELFEFSIRIAKNLRELNKKSKTIVLKIKYDNFVSITRNFTLNKATDSQNEIYENGCMLLDNNWDSEKKVRLIGLSCTNFSEEENDIEQLTLFENAEEDIEKEEQKEIKNEKYKKLDMLMDKLEDKFGNQVLMKAKSLKNKGDNNE